MKYILLLLCVFPLISAKLRYQERESMLCIGAYLENLKLINSSSSSESDQPMKDSCKRSAEAMKEELMKAIRKDIEQKAQEDVMCIMDRLKKVDLGNSLLMLEYYESMKGGDKDKKREAKPKQIKAVILHELARSYLLCQTERKVGKIFDESLNEDRHSMEDPKEDYCIRKHIRDNKLMDIDNLSIDLNPRNIDTSNTDCEALYRKAVKLVEIWFVESMLNNESIEGHRDQEKVSCLLGVVRQDNLIDKLFQYNYVKEMNANEMQKKEMRENYIKLVTNLAGNFSKCFM